MLSDIKSLEIAIKGTRKASSCSENKTRYYRPDDSMSPPELTPKLKVNNTWVQDIKSPHINFYKNLSKESLFSLNSAKRSEVTTFDKQIQPITVHKIHKRRYNLRLEDFKNCSMEDVTNERIKQSHYCLMQSKRILQQLEENAPKCEVKNFPQTREYL